MKLMLVNVQFKTGGAARVAAIMCNGFFYKGYDLLVIADTKNTEIVYELDSRIPILPLYTSDMNRRKNSKFKLLYEAVTNLRHYIKQYNPDVILAVEAYIYVRVFVANLFLNYPVIAADHTSFNRKMDRLINFTRHFLYKYADGLSILTERDNRILGTKFPRKEVIYNPLSFPCLDYPTNRRKNILCAGRLDVWRIKGVDIIIDIWSELAANYPEWTLEIAGGGSDTSTSIVNDMINKHNLSGRVKLLGSVNDMQTLYQETSIFVLPSRVEGFPMVLMEAMSQGCASVAFSIQGASHEMVDKGAGFVVEDGDKTSFKDSLVMLLENEKVRNEMSRMAIDSVKKYSQEAFIQHWEDYINKILKNRNNGKSIYTEM